MARIAGVDLPNNKRIEIALTYIFGIGRTLSKKILVIAGIDENIRAKDLSNQEVKELREIITDNYTIEGDLRKENKMNLNRLKEIGCYRGLRHRIGLPCRGQKTHANARTLKGPRLGRIKK
ncbi:MAG: 30S ribosomal protein S13 [Candidatus Cloacimonadota bacterium]|nr:30S ribosomal protein S13 [Candidatus Cloacimonadota bacterium]